MDRTAQLNAPEKTRYRAPWLAAVALISATWLTPQPSLEDSLVWPQFVAGGPFEAELRLSNGSRTQDWSGELRLADQQANPMSGVMIEIVDGLTSEPLVQGTAQVSLTIPPRSSLLARFTSSSPTPLIGFLTLTPSTSQLQVSTTSASQASSTPEFDAAAALDQLATDFAYNLKNEGGAVVDRIPVPPVTAGTAFLTTLGRQPGFDSGLAIVSLEPTTVEVILHRSDSDRISASRLLLGQSAFFPSELIEGLPLDLDAALLEIRSSGSLIAVTSLEVVSPPLGDAVQIAGKSVKRTAAGCQALASGLTFADPAPASAGFALSKVASDDDAVYWFEFNPSLGGAGGAFKRASKERGLVSTLSEGLGGVNDFALDATSLYWSEFVVQSGAGSIRKVSKGGGNPLTLASETPSGSSFAVFLPGALVVDDAFVYWGESSGGGAIRRVSKAGGAVVDIGRGQGFGPVSMVLDGGFFYGGTFDRIGRLPAQGGVLQVLASSLPNPMSLLTDDQFVYWVELVEDGRIARVAKEGGAVTQLAGGISNVRSLALDAATVFFPSSPSGQLPGQPSVRQVPKGGGEVTTAAQCAGTGDLTAPLFVALDASAFYVSDNVQAGQARIVKLPR